MSPNAYRTNWMNLLAAAALFAVSVLGSPAPTQSEISGASEIPMTIGQSIALDVPDEIQRVSITDDEVADAVPISTREVLINAKAEGVTSLVLWSRAGDRSFFVVRVTSDVARIEQHIMTAFPEEDVDVMVSGNVITLNGKVSGPGAEERVIAFASGFAQQVISNLELPIPDAEQQILLKVRFVEVQRNALNQFGAQILSTGAANTPGALGTQQFGNSSVNGLSGTIPGGLLGTTTSFGLSDTLNIFAFRPDLNLGALLRLLSSKGMSQILAEPNLITTSGKQADLLVGGEFPVPIVQGGASSGAATVSFREFGIRIGFLPELTARGSIKMHIKPEVSTLDFANAVTLSGFLIPALSTRRVETDVELMPGQSFVIGGLIDQRVTETLNRIPGLSKIPLLGELFKSRSLGKNNTELLVLVTPEFPEAYRQSEPVPHLEMPIDFLPVPERLTAER